MPTQTFFNLPEEKRDKIIEAAIEEFAANYFDSASIASIVKKAGIPRGSFYQYFEDLKDIYTYLFEVIAARKMKYMQHVLDHGPDALSIVRELYAAGLRFAQDHPTMAAVGLNFFREDPQLRREIMGEFAGGARLLLQEVLAEGQRQGEINPQIDVEMAAFALQALSVAITDDHIERMDDDVDPFADEGYSVKVDKMLFILERGLMNPESGSEAEPIEEQEEGRECSR